MCKCNECDKKDSDNCMRILEEISHQQTETMKIIEIESLKYNYNNLLKGVEKMIQLMSSEALWKIKNIERENKSSRRIDE